MKKRTQTTAVAIHGQFLPLEVWKRVMWGDPRNGVYGVIPKGLLLGQTEGATAIYISHERPQDGSTPPPNPRTFAEAHASELPFKAAAMIRLMVVNDSVRNTNQEVQWIAKMVGDYPVNRIYSVSAPKHTFRAHQEFLVAQAEGRINKAVTILAVASAVDFPDTSAAMVAIMEPMHRPDMPRWNTWRYCRGIIELMKRSTPEQFEAFLIGLRDLLARHGMSVGGPPRG
jgi:hypothetical protein